MTDAPGRRYWDATTAEYQARTRISCGDFHYGPLLPGDAELCLLPRHLNGLRCLELGCGAGQNSIVLARKGALCTALDLSQAQLKSGRALAAKHSVSIRFIQADIDALPISLGPVFDLVHSVYALPFVKRPAKAIANAAELLRPGGTLIAVFAHPAFAGEWLELDDRLGILIESYFSPRPDRRQLSRNGVHTVCQAYPLGLVHGWICSAGLEVCTLAEPRAAPIPQMTEAAISKRVPYDSPAWRHHYSELARVPGVAIFVAEKRGTTTAFCA